MTLPQETIDAAKQFAFYNYCAAAQHPNANFQDIETWPSSAQVAYYAIVGFLSGKEMHWPSEVPELIMQIAGATEWAGKAQGLVEALEFVKINGLCSETTDMINNALAKYKEVTNG